MDVYLGDERCVPPDDPDSNHRMIAEVLLGPVGPVRSDHPMYRSGPPEAAAAAYQKELDRTGSAPSTWSTSGMGPDGHCASLFPGSVALEVDDPGVLVMANRDPKANNAHDRITLTLPAIARARLVVFTVSGESKRSPSGASRAGEDLPAGAGPGRPRCCGWSTPRPRRHRPLPVQPRRVKSATVGTPGSPPNLLR